MNCICGRVRPAALAVGLALVLALAAQPRAEQTNAAPPRGEWKPLFNGKDLTGWTVAAGRAGTAAKPAEWKAEDGVLIGGQGDGRGSLISNDQFKDFELELDYMLTEHGTQCSAELVGPEQANASAEKSCLYNSGITFRTGYQLNLGRREAGEFVGIVVHRKVPGAIRGNVLWLDKGDDKHPGLRKKDGWNSVRLSAKGPHLQAWLNGTKICDVMDDPADPAEARWKEAGPISLQWPPAGEAGGFPGTVKYRKVRIREL